MSISLAVVYGDRESKILILITLIKRISRGYSQPTRLYNNIVKFNKTFIKIIRKSLITMFLSSSVWWIVRFSFVILNRLKCFKRPLSAFVVSLVARFFLCPQYSSVSLLTLRWNEQFYTWLGRFNEHEKFHTITHGRLVKPYRKFYNKIYWMVIALELNCFTLGNLKFFVSAITASGHMKHDHVMQNSVVATSRGSWDSSMKLRVQNFFFIDSIR